VPAEPDDSPEVDTGASVVESSVVVPLCIVPIDVDVGMVVPVSDAYVVPGMAGSAESPQARRKLEIKQR